MSREMTDLLTRPRALRTSGTTPDDSPRRPLWLTAAMAGATASGAVLAGCMALALVAWFLSDAGAHGDTRDALRVGADAWLLGHGAGLALPEATVSVVPLGLTGLCVYVAFRLGRRAAATSYVEDARTLGLGVVVLAGTYAVIALLTAVLAATADAAPSPGRAFLGGALVASLGGGLGLARGSAVGAEQWDRLDRLGVGAVVRGAVAAAMLLVAAGSVLVLLAFLLDLGTAANVLARLHTDPAGGALYTTLVAAVAPNLALLGGAYLLGPGFAVGTGTVVSPAMVTLGPMPAFPLVAALPPAGPGPTWASALVAVPFLLAVVAAGLTAWHDPVLGYRVAAARSLGVGLLGGLLAASLVLLAGGSIGPGRMSEIGAPALATLGVGMAAFGLGGLVGGLAATWWLRRRTPGAPTEDTEDTVIL